jgi:hypothetical protein
VERGGLEADTLVQNTASPGEKQTSGTNESGGLDENEEMETILSKREFGTDVKGLGSQFDHAFDNFFRRYPPNSKGKGKAQEESSSGA